jgi:hypothetical protein
MARIVKWAVRLEAIDADGKKLELSDLMTIARDVDRADRDDFGLKLSEGYAILEQLQARIAQHQVDQMAMRNRLCAGCRSERPIHDYRSRQTRCHSPRHVEDERPLPLERRRLGLMVQIQR